MKEYFVFLLLMLIVFVCYSKSEDKIKSLVNKKCEEYKDKYFEANRTDFQERYGPPRPKNSHYLINGRNVLLASNPHMAALGYTINNKINWVCGGSLISEQYVLTAAHCLKKRIKSEIQEVEIVRLGVINLTAIYESYPKDYKIIKRIAHPSYEPPSKYNDIGLLQLESMVEITLYIKPICLYTEYRIPINSQSLYEPIIYNYEDHIIRALGWGFTKPTGNPSEILQYVNLRLYEEEECNNAYAMSSMRVLEKGILHDRQICLGSSSTSMPEDACQGDSGGPVNLYTFKENHNNNLYLFGITSFGKSCGLLKSPGIYTRVSFYVPWIVSVVWPNEN